MKNVGKIFEEQIRKSIPPYVLMYRLPDAAQSFVPSDGLRFSAKNPFDFLWWDSIGHILIAVEAKTVAGKSVSFERAKGDRGDIHLHQIEGLRKWSEYDGIAAGLLIEFRQTKQTVFVPISSFLFLADKITKKSFTVKDLDEHCARYYSVLQIKKRVRYLYDIDTLVENLRQS